MTLRIPVKVLIHVWSYDFYDMTLPTGKLRRHMINELTGVWYASAAWLIVATLLQLNTFNNAILAGFPAVSGISIW